MDYQVNAKLLTAESKPYSIDGNEGVSHRIRLNVNGEIYSCKSSEQQVNELKAYQGKDGEALLRLDSRKEALSLKLVSFDPTEQSLNSYRKRLCRKQQILSEPTRGMGLADY